MTILFSCKKTTCQTHLRNACVYLDKCLTGSFKWSRVLKNTLWLFSLCTCTLSYIYADSLGALIFPILLPVFFYSLGLVHKDVAAIFSFPEQILSSLPQRRVAARWAPIESGNNLLSLLQGSAAVLISHSPSPGGLTSPCILMLHDGGCRLISPRFDSAVLGLT